MPDKREKASEVIGKTNYVFAKKVDSFAEAYPTIARLRVEVAEYSGPWDRDKAPWVITETDFRHAVDCSNQLCYGGGVEVGWIIHDMVRQHLTEFEISKPCRGYEGTAKRRDRSCVHTFTVKATIVYKAPPPSKDRSPSSANSTGTPPP